METAFCDTCKNVIILGELKRKPKIVEEIATGPQNLYPTTWRFAIFKCPCGAKSGSSIRATS
jgi:hypothetical protein